MAEAAAVVVVVSRRVAAEVAAPAVASDRAVVVVGAVGVAVAVVDVDAARTGVVEGMLASTFPHPLSLALVSIIEARY